MAAPASRLMQWAASCSLESKRRFALTCKILVLVPTLSRASAAAGTRGRILLLRSFVVCSCICH